ncbi:MAG: DUF1540 domain-containing protein [Oscillospiraceae bacterium]|nr:DUF1540 domain-containing protein [Oscillospiraceae bacterium]
MNNQEFANKNIECSVTNCVHHCTNGDYCALKRISVGTHGNKSDTSDCRSFECKPKNC